MLNALSQSPITANQFFEWNTKLQNDEILVREIIDIDTNYMEEEDSNNASKEKKAKMGKMITVTLKKMKIQMMSSTQLLPLWKTRLNQSFKYNS